MVGLAEQAQVGGPDHAQRPGGGERRRQAGDEGLGGAIFGAGGGIIVAPGVAVAQPLRSERIEPGRIDVARRVGRQQPPGFERLALGQRRVVVKKSA
ncbi:hypothetical protein GCM10007973_22770 [Polymorphobacter multimanifer]|nr:hypothetical protein GCM10007973_22770 [Polymorphobacter multimanifer]